MSIAKFNLQLREGATYRRRWRWLDAKQRAINLTGMVFQIDFRDKPDGVLLLPLTAANGRLVITPLVGTINLVLTSAETAALAFTKAAWDCRVTMSNGDVDYIAEGFVLVTRSVTE